MFLLKLYNAKKICVSLDNLRLPSYMQIMKKTKKRKSSSIASFKLESLQPTTAKYHAYRDYLAVQEWLGNSLQATDWGWDYNVICSVQPTQPHPILDYIWCHVGVRCSCYKAGLDCSVMCLTCIGQNCIINVRLIVIK